MVNAHAPLQSLGPAEWDTLPHADIGAYINNIFSQAMIVVESIPSPSSAAAPATPNTAGRARAKTESAVLFNDTQRSRTLRQSPASLEAAAALRKDWKEVKVNPKENPLGINVYKMSSKDGKGAWFARQSIHEGLSFDNWRAGLEREFAESLKVQGSPGVGNIRGIGADRHVEDREIQDAGHLSVFQLSAQFPGPTSPRDFITLLLTSDLSHKAENLANGLRQYVIVSKPCSHDQCPPRQGIIRGQYESVEIIREVHVEPSMARRSMSATDLAINEERNADKRLGGSEILPDKQLVAVEWLMVTRSDPGGSVPRFLIEKGTPPGIVGDAGKFLKWITTQSRRGWGELDESTESKDVATGERLQETATTSTKTARAAATARSYDGTYDFQHHNQNSDSVDDADDSIPSSNGLYGIITGIFGVASSVVANGLGLNYASSEESVSTIPTVNITQPRDEDSDSDSSSVRSFLSALEKRLTLEAAEHPGTTSSNARDAAQSEDSKSSTTANQNPAAPASVGSSGEKELRKLEERRRKIDEKMALMETRLESKSQGDKAKDAAALAKFREKLEREAAKQELKYRKELQKLDEKREQEAAKAERRRRKTLEKQEKSNMSLELERTRAERDLARQHNSILEGQVRELQAQNTQLVATLGRLRGQSGGSISSSPSVSSLGNTAQTPAGKPS